MSTRADIRALVKKKMRDMVTGSSTEATFADDDEINGVIEESRVELIVDLAQWEDCAANLPGTTTVSMTYAADAESVALPTTPVNAAQSFIQKAAWRMAGTSYTSIDDVPLMASSLDEFERFYVSGNPAAYAVVGPNIYLRPRPDSAVNITLWVLPLPVPLTDTSAPSELPASFHHYYAIDVACRFKDSMGDPPSRLHVQRDELHERIERYFTMKSTSPRIRFTQP